MFEQLLNHLKDTCPIPVIQDYFFTMPAGFHRRKHEIYYNPIRIFMENENIVHVILHELVHATQIYIKRWNDYQNKSDIEKSIEEIIADNVALRLMDYYSINSAQNKYSNRNYIQAYTKELGFTPETELMEKEAFNYILNNWLKGFEFDKQSEAA